MTKDSLEGRVLNLTCQRFLILLFIAGVLFLMPPLMQAQSDENSSIGSKGEERTFVTSHPGFLPLPVALENFSELREQSPFLRPLNVAGSLALTGIARIEDDTVATMIDLETFQSFLVSSEINGAGWQLVEVKGDRSDIESLTARIRVGGADVFSVRYEEAPVQVKGMKGVAVSTRIGNGSPGGGTGPHGGPDPRVLTPDQLDDAKNAARNIRDGFQADGYPDKQTIPPEVVSKISRLSVSQRESINVKMFEYRNRGLGLPERQQIYNRLLDRELSQR
ncbi:MAG: hypothetical protein P1U58_17275 [Verrucomicrobiales bacterium]|nr:hypothetical protein [Verrucomicrobiales bacterium]